MNKTIRYIVVRLIIVTGFVLLCGTVYEMFFYPKTLQEEGWLKELATRRLKNKADILYFSASPNASVAPTDTDQRSISQMLQSELPKYSVAPFDTGAIHAGIFLHAVKNLPFKPELIVMDLNLRSFGLQWIHSDLENVLQRNLAYWNDRPGLVNRMNVTLKNYPFILDHERREMIYYREKFGKLPFAGSHETIRLWADSLFYSPLKAAGGHEMIAHFAFTIDKENWMLLQYDAIVEYCRQARIPLVFMILPENVGGMQEKVGPDLVKLCRMNVSFLKNHYAGRAVSILDLSEKLPQDVFFEDFPTEHYVATGRNEVAKALAGHISNILSK